MRTLPENQVAGLYHHRIGDILVTAVSDGYYDTPMTAYQGMAEEELAARFRAGFQRVPPRVAINTFLIQSGGRTALVDTGAGGTMGATLGKLPETLKVLGVALTDIDTILLTHLHPDHSNGLVGDQGQAQFPSTEIVVSEIDVKFRHDDAERSKYSKIEQKRYFDEARRQLAPYADRMRDAQGDVFPGVTAVSLPGHTPGHTGYMVSSGDESLLIWGDICHAQELQLQNPNVTVAFDVDKDQAIQTRRRTLDLAAQDKLLIAGMHVHFPGFIHVVREGSGYAAIPEIWAYEMS